MLGEIGYILTGLSLVVSLYAALATAWSIYSGDRRWAESGRHAIFATTALLGLGVALLTAAFLDDRFRLSYVALHSGRDLPFYLKLSAVWAGQEGSLLLWAFLQALFAALIVRWPSARARALLPWATVFLSLITAFFVAVTLFLSNPFRLLPVTPPDGQGLNPLLRHPGMVFHPPAMYVGYVGLAIPYALAMAALVTGRIKEWPTAARRWTLAAWLFLGIGLLLGARWAYDVLGWGGYWGWDPVENAGLMPWLVATALLHGTVMQEERQGFRVWNVILAILSFALVLFGTFVTRSGLIQSVHAFARSNLGIYFLAFIGLTMGGGLVLLVVRLLDGNQALQAERESDGLLSRDGLFLLTLILFLTLTASVFIGSVLPTLTDVLLDQRFEAGSSWFDGVTGPQFALLVLIMGICPLLGRAVQSLRRLKAGALPALLGLVLVVGVAALAGFTDWVSLAGFALVGLAGATTLAEVVRDVGRRVSGRGESIPRAVWQLVGRQRRKYGGYLVHAGVILMAVGVIGTRVYPFETERVLAVDEPVAVGEYTLIYEDLGQEILEDRIATWASVALYRGGDYLTTLQPRIDRYVGFETVGIPAVRPGLREDVYLVLAAVPGDAFSVPVKIFVNPLATFLWLGGLVFLAGGAIALWPPAHAARLTVPEARRRTVGTVAGLAAGLAILVLAGWAMWGTGQGTASLERPAPAPTTPQPDARASGRIRPGQPAPDFTVELLDGPELSLSELRGQVVVLNFWAPWCEPCEEELPDFQRVWEGYQEQDVLFLGLAFEEDEADVREMIAELGITYPIGFDVGDQVSAAYGITGIPETFVVDAEGNVAYVHVGPVTGGVLGEQLDSLLEE